MKSALPSDLTDRLRLAVRAGDVGLWDWDLRTNEVFYSKEWKSQLGHTEDEVTNSFAEWENRVHPDDLAPTLAKVQAFLANPVPGFAVEFRMRHKDGSYRWILAQADVLRDESGQPARMLGCHLDITERKQGEAARRESEERFSSAFHTSPAAITITRVADGTFIDVNQAFLNLFEFTRDEVIGHTSTELNMLSAAERGQLIRKQLDTGGLRDAELLARAKSGRPVHLLFSSKPMTLAGELHHVTTLIDITARKQAEVALRDSEARHRFLFEHMLNGFAHCEMLFEQGRPSDYRYLAVNRAFETQTGLKNVAGKRVSEIIPGIQAADPGLFVILGRVATTGRPEQFEIYLTSLQTWFAISAYSPAQNQFVAVFDVITERKQAEAALRESEEEFRLLAEHSMQGIVLIQGENFIYVNPAYCAITGYSVAESLAQTLAQRLELVHPEDRAQVIERQARFARGEAIAETSEVRIIGKDGRQRWVLAASKSFVLKGKPARLGMLVDITARKQAEQERQKFFLLAESSSEFIGMCDLDMKPLYVNPAGVRMVGLPDMDAACRVKVQDYFFPEDQRFIAEEFFPRVLREGHGDVEIRLRHFQTGEPIWMSYYLFHVHDADGRVIGWATVSSNITERKRAEEELRRSTELLQSILDNLPASVFWKDRDSRYLGCNKLFSGAAGLEQPSAILGKTDYELAWRASADRYRADDRQVMEAKTPKLNYEEPQSRPDGSTCWLRTSKTPLLDADGNALGVLGVYMDITERKQMEVRLRASEQHVRQLLDSTAEGYYSVDTQGNCTLVNRAGLRLLGYDKEEELLGRHIHELTHHTRPDGRPYPKEECRMYQAMCDRMATHVDDEVFWRRDGTSFQVEYWSYPIIREGQLLGAVASFLDITARKQAEANQRLSSAALAAAANEVVITDRQGIIQWVNPAFTKTTGYTLEEAVGQNPRFLKSGKHDSAFYHKLWSTILRGEVWRGEMVNRKKDGSLFTEESIITPVKDEQGAITHFVAIKQDISERKLLEAKFLRAQRLEGLGALAGGVAHDLNNVLAPILMSAELLHSMSADPQTRRLLEMIQANSQRGAGMIRQILAFARGTAGEKIVMQVGHLLKDISKMMHETFPPSIQCELRVAPGLEPVLGESTELYQVLLNLCVNARDAMPQGGTITLGAENIRLDETYARLSQEARPGHYVVLTVADTGGGIPKEIQERIFDPFFTTKEPGKGTGLGLATVKDIVTGHGGFIHLYSDVGVGTQFKIYLPVAQGEEATEETTFLTLPGGHGELVLVVDDEAAVREIVKATLEGYGYRVVAAGDGTEAVARFVEHMKEVQLLLTDMQMPHMDGAATIRALRNIQPGLRVIAASGLNTHEAALKATGLEVQGFIAKPFTAANLLLALDTALRPK